MLAVTKKISQTDFVVKQGKIIPVQTPLPRSSIGSYSQLPFWWSEPLFRKKVEKPFIGRNPKRLTTNDLYLSLQINQRSEWLMLILTAVFVFIRYTFYSTLI